MLLRMSKRTALGSSLPVGRLVTTTVPPELVIGPTLAFHGAPICSVRPLPLKFGGDQVPGVGWLSTMPQIEPEGTLTVLTPGLGSVTLTGLGPVYGPPGPLQVTVNR